MLKSSWTDVNMVGRSNTFKPSWACHAGAVRCAMLGPYEIWDPFHFFYWGA